MRYVLWLLAALFCWLAIDAVRSHGLHSPAFRPSTSEAPPHENLTKPIVNRSGLGLAAVFAAIGMLCVACSMLLDTGDA
jgi:hypothetical protein